MPINAILAGGLLMAIAAAGYIHGIMNDKASVTALIPGFFGIVIALLGVAANSSESLRKHLMHAAVLIALIGFLVPTVRLLSKFSELAATPAILAQAAMALICLAFVLLSIRSFINARRS